MAITPEQREQRRNSIGSSDAPLICRLAPKLWGDPLSVYLDKLGVLPERTSDAMTLGTLMEPVIAKLYEQETGCELTDPGRTFHHPLIPHMAANIDRQRKHDHRIVEIKMVGGEFSSEWGTPGTDEVPPYVLCQSQHQMEVLKVGHVDVAALFLNLRRIQIYTIRYSKEFVNLLLGIEAEFWDRVQRRDPPEPDWTSPKTPELMAILHRPDPDVTIQLPAIASLLVDEDARLDAHIDAGTTRRAEVRGRLHEMMGTAGVGLLEDGRRVVRSSYTRNGKVVTQLRISKARA